MLVHVCISFYLFKLGREGFNSGMLDMLKEYVLDLSGVTSGIMQK